LGLWGIGSCSLQIGILWLFLYLFVFLLFLLLTLLLWLRIPGLCWIYYGSHLLVPFLLTWSHQLTGFWVGFSSFVHQFNWNYELRLVCQFVQGGQSVVFTSWQLCYPSTAALFDQHLPKQGGIVQFWMLPSSPGDQLWDPLPALLWEVTYCSPPLSAFTAFPVFVHWEFSAEILAPCLALVL
jgi:hypothetical protein